MTTSEHLSCPNCGHSDTVRTVSEAAASGEPALVQKLGAPLSPRHHGKSLGCGTMLISTLAGFIAGAIVGSLVIGVGLDVPGRVDISVRDTGIFSAILVFMVVFVAVFAAFVWRQARADALLQVSILRWHRAHKRWEQLAYCARCDGVFAPGQARLVPADQLQSYLYQEERPASPSQPAPAAQ